MADQRNLRAELSAQAETIRREIETLATLLDAIGYDQAARQRACTEVLDPLSVIDVEFGDLLVDVGAS